MVRADEGGQLADDARALVELALRGRVAPEAVAAWAYEHTDLAGALGAVAAVDLLEHDYQADRGGAQLRRLLVAIYRDRWPGPQADRLAELAELADLARQVARGGLARPARELAQRGLDRELPAELHELAVLCGAHSAEIELCEALHAEGVLRGELAAELAQIEREYQPRLLAAARQALRALGVREIG